MPEARCLHTTGAKPAFWVVIFPHLMKPGLENVGFILRMLVLIQIKWTAWSCPVSNIVGCSFGGLQDHPWASGPCYRGNSKPFCCYSIRLWCQTSWWIPTPNLSGYREVPYGSLRTTSLPTHRDVPYSEVCRPFQQPQLLLVGENPPGLQGRQWKTGLMGNL